MDGGAWWAAVLGVAKSRTRQSDFTFTFHFHALEKEMATHSSVLGWRIPGTGEPDGLPSMGSHRVGHNWSDLAAAAASALWATHPAMAPFKHLAPPWPQWGHHHYCTLNFPLPNWLLPKTLYLFNVIHSIRHWISFSWFTHSIHNYLSSIYSAPRHWEHSCERVLTSWYVYCRHWERWRYGTKKKKKNQAI